MALLTLHNPVVPFHIWLGFDAVSCLLILMVFLLVCLFSFRGGGACLYLFIFLNFIFLSYSVS